MTPVYSRALGLLLALLAISGCGGGDDEPQRVADEGGLATYEVRSFGFSVGVPSDWQTLNVDDVLTEEALESMREADPDLGPFLDAMEAEDSPIKLFAIDPEPDDGFTANFNVVVLDAPEGTTREEYFQASTAQLEGLGVDGLEEERVDLPAGDALHATYEHMRGGTERPLAVSQYVLFEGRTGYTLTYTSLADAFDRHEDEFERSAESFRTGL
jgi:hypothetical protein